MNTIKPATSLPQVCVDRTRGNPQFYFVGNGQSPTDEHAHEIARRSNNYPKLVAALQLIEHTAISGLDGDTRAACDDVRLQALALLREIGEA